MRLWRVVGLGAVILGVSYLTLLGSYFGVWSRLWKMAHPSGPPPRTQPLPYGAEIIRQREADQVRRLSQEYARVKALVDEARGQGIDVSSMDRLLFATVSLGRQKRYDHALTLLNRIEVSIPRRGEGVRPARLDDELPKEPELRTKSLDVPRRRARKRD